VATPRTPTRVVRPRHLAVTASLLALAVVGASAWKAAEDTFAVDFYQFWAVGQAARAVRDPYDGVARERIAAAFRDAGAAAPGSRLEVVTRYRPVLETYSTPFLYGVFGATSSGVYERDLVRFQRVSLVAFVVGVVLLGRAGGLGPAPSLLVVAVLVAASVSFASELKVGNVGRLQVGLLGVAAWLLSRPGDLPALMGGVLLGAGVAFKPTLLLAAAGPLAARAMGGRPVSRLALGLVSGALLGVVAGAATFGGPAVWIRWANAMAGLPPTAITRELGNSGLVSLVGGGPAVSAIVSLALVVGWAMFLRHRRPVPDLPALASGLLLTLLGSALTWVHYYVLAAPALCVALARSGTSRRLALVALVLMTSWPHVLGHPGRLGETVLLVTATLLLLGALGLDPSQERFLPTMAMPAAASASTVTAAPNLARGGR
jgi:hypothetical protein